MSKMNVVAALFVVAMLPMQACDLTIEEDGALEGEPEIGEVAAEATVTTPRFGKLWATQSSTSRCLGKAIYVVRFDHRTGQKTYEVGMKADTCQPYNNWGFMAGDRYWDGKGYFYGEIADGGGNCLTNRGDNKAWLDPCNGSVSQKWYAWSPTGSSYLNFTNYAGPVVCLNYEASAPKRVQLGTCGAATEWYLDML